MTISSSNYLPSILTFSTFLVIYCLLVYIRKTIRLNLESRKRKIILNQFTHIRTRQLTRIKKQVNTVKFVAEQYSGKLIKGAYKEKLQQLLINSGDWENRRYSKLVRNKLVVSITVFVSFFILLLVRDLNTFPIVLSVIVVSYIYPDIEHRLKRIFSSEYRVRLFSLLDRAGNWNELEYFRLVRRKVIFALFGFTLSYLYLLTRAQSTSSLVYVIVGAVFGFFLPDILLQNRVLKRREEIANTLPDAIDMLQMCVGAGLAFSAALSRVSDTQSGAVAEEFARVTTEVQLGKSRSEALASLAKRTQEKNVQKFVSAMQQVSTFGIPVHNVLLEQAKEMRANRRERAREKGQKLPIKILAPIMVFFLPTVLIMVLGPAIISLVRAFG